MTVPATTEQIGELARMIAAHADTIAADRSAHPLAAAQLIIDYANTLAAWIESVPSPVSQTGWESSELVRGFTWCTKPTEMKPT